MKEYDFNDNSDLDDKKDVFNAHATLAKLYTDKTHLVYELLQNAEDCRAKRVRFAMYADRLEMWHDGEPFTAENLRSIRSLAQSEKVDRLNAIGKFGVGFRAVFCICETVEVYSSPENFAEHKPEHLPRFAIRIEDFREKVKIPFEKKFREAFTTCFVFPFAVTSKGKESLGLGYSSMGGLRAELSRKLLTFGSDAMLFLKNIAEISYLIEIGENRKEGKYLLDKANLGNGAAKITAHVHRKEMGDGAHEESSFIKYSAPAPQGNGKTVDILFAAEWSGETPKFVKPHEKHRSVFVYFPTATESKLDFIVQAPFMTTPNRESVPPTERDNKELAEEAAELLEKAVHDAKRRGWLSLDFLGLLPIEESYPSDWLFRPMLAKTKDMFMRTEMKILPAEGGGFVSARDANFASSKELAKVFGGDALGRLLGNRDAAWLTTALTEHGRHEKLWRYLKSEKGAGIPEREPQYLPGLIGKMPGFFGAATKDEWLADFYNYIAGLGSHVKERFREVVFVKTESGGFAKPDRESLFARPDAHAGYSGDFTFVAGFVAEKCGDLLDYYKIAPPDGFDWLKKEMDAHHAEAAQNKRVDAAQCARFLKEALRQANKEGAAAFFKEKLWLRCIKPNGGIIWSTAKQNSIFFINDEKNISILSYLKGTLADAFVLDEEWYVGQGIDRNELRLLGKFGVIGTVCDYGEEAWIDKERGASCKNLGDFKLSLDFRHCSDVLKYIGDARPLAREKSGILFRLLCSVRKHLKGRWQYGRAQPEYIDDESFIVGRLAKCRWLFSANGALRCASEISRYELDAAVYGDVDETSDIYDILGFAKTELDESKGVLSRIGSLPPDKMGEFANSLTPAQRDALLRGLGFGAGENQDGGEDDDFDFEAYEAESAEAFPESSERDLASRPPIKRSYYEAADYVEYEVRPRSVRKHRDIEADREYVRGRYRGFCQMCEKRMGHWRLCALFLKPKKELRELNLSLCPWCAAEYANLRRDGGAMGRLRKTLLAADTNGSPIIPVIGGRTLRFTKAHLADVREILGIETGAENPHAQR